MFLQMHLAFAQNIADTCLTSLYAYRVDAYFSRPTRSRAMSPIETDGLTLSQEHNNNLECRRDQDGDNNTGDPFHPCRWLDTNDEQRNRNLDQSHYYKQNMLCIPTVHIYELLVAFRESWAWFSFASGNSFDCKCGFNDSADRGHCNGIIVRSECSTLLTNP